MEQVGHRGVPRRAPENTLASLRRAIAEGKKAVEADLRRTKDGVWVVFHDRSLRRTTGHSGWLAHSRWDEIRSLSAGGWFSPRFRGERIPRAAELFALCRRKKVNLFLDLKVPGGEKQLMDQIRRYGDSHRVALGVGSPSAAEAWRALLGSNSLYWVTGFRIPLTSRRIGLAKRLGFNGFISFKRWVTSHVVQQVHEAGLTLYVWTIRTAAEQKRFLSLGVDGIMSEV